MADDRFLEPFAGESDLFAVMLPQSGPAVVGDADPGVNWCCAGCGTVLASAVHPGQFLDLLFRCYRCGQLGGSPPREPGQPLAGRPVLIPLGRYRLDDSVRVTGRPVMMVGQQALDGYLFETGRVRPSQTPGQELNAEYLNRLAREATALLGDSYASLRASDRRGRISPTPPPRRHRLIELIDYAQEAADALEILKPDKIFELDAYKVSELDGLVSLLDRWKNHPAWKHLTTSLEGENDTHHTLILLAFASYLCDSENGVGIFFENRPEHRIADLWAQPSLIERLDVEIKTPLDFRGPLGSPINDEIVEHTVERLLKKAASTKSGQISADDSGIVVFGAFHLSEADTQQIVSACEHVLNKQRDRKHHLAAIAVTSFRPVQTIVRDAAGLTRRSLAAVIETKVIRHPGYTGSLTLHDEARPRGNWISALS